MSKKRAPQSELQEAQKQWIIEELDRAKNNLHQTAKMVFKGDISDPIFCELSKRANTIATLRRQIYSDELEMW